MLILGASSMQWMYTDGFCYQQIAQQILVTHMCRRLLQHASAVSHSCLEVMLVYQEYIWS